MARWQHLQILPDRRSAHRPADLEGAGNLRNIYGIEHVDGRSSDFSASTRDVLTGLLERIALNHMPFCATISSDVAPTYAELETRLHWAFLSALVTSLFMTLRRFSMKRLTYLLLAVVSSSSSAIAQSDLPTYAWAQAPAVNALSPAAATPQPYGSTVLFDSRPLMITNPGGGFGGADASALQGLSSLIGSSATGGNRLSEDFAVPDGGWLLDSVTVFAYQTGSTTTSTIVGMTLQIWDGNPSLPMSNVIFGDTSTNVLTGSTFTNIFRTSGPALTNTQRPIMANVASGLSVSLPAGTYWLDWSLSGNLPSGPWGPFVTIPGQNASGDAQQLTLGTWGLIVDPGSTFNQTLPLTLIGSVEGDLIFADGFDAPLR